MFRSSRGNFIPEKRLPQPFLAARPAGTGAEEEGGGGAGAGRLGKGAKSAENRIGAKGGGR